jgi:dTDP-3-amino-3,4,6-trideoxy-alpha-D-glucose transaminase
VNSRLDELQAAVLRARLSFLRRWTDRRRALAARYREALSDAAPGAANVAGLPIAVPPELDAGHVYHLFPVLSRDRDALQSALAADGVDTMVHYPIAVPRQPAMAAWKPADCPVAERVASEVLSLPLYPSMPDEHVDIVAAALAAAPRR